MTKTPLTRIDLNNSGCGAAGCTHDHSILHLHGACHPRGGIEAAYTKATGTITFRCYKCKSFVAEISVAQGVLQ